MEKLPTADPTSNTTYIIIQNKFGNRFVLNLNIQIDSKTGCHHKGSLIIPSCSFLKNLNSLWSRAQSKLLANFFNFTTKYVNSTIAARNNLYLWGLLNTFDCSFCLQPESLLHIVAGCKTYLDQGRFTWRYNSALYFLAQTFQSVN